MDDTVGYYCYKASIFHSMSTPYGIKMDDTIGYYCYRASRFHSMSAPYGIKIIRILVLKTPKNLLYKNVL